ncbi:hypothetical protein QTO34_002418, partial [Cnephaeus nilssonii]
MAFTLYSLLQAALLCVNAIAVLHEERFLKNSEWDVGPGGGGGGTAGGRGPETAARGTAWGGTGQEAAKGLRRRVAMVDDAGVPHHPSRSRPLGSVGRRKGGSSQSEVGWGTDQGIGGFGEEPGIKSQLMNLIRSVRTVMR